MTIAIVSNSTWNIANFRLNVVDKLLKEGHKVVVIAPIDEYIEYKEKYPQVQHVALRTLGRKSVNPLRDVLLTLELIRKYRRLQPDLILHYTHKPNIFGGIAAGVTKKVSFGVVTGIGYAFIHKGLINNLIQLLYKYACQFHSEMIFENLDDRELFRRRKIINLNKGKTVKGCGVDLDYFKALDNKRVGEKLIFTFIGRLLYDKGIEEFIRAAETIKIMHPQIEFWIIGELDNENPSMIDNEKLLKWIENDIIDYHGFVRDVRPIIQGSDCIVLPSYSEGMPRTIIEATAMAKPAIVTDVPGCRETVVDGKNGYLVDVKNVDSLVEAMEKMLALTPEERKAMGQEGRKLAEKEFDDKKIANDIYDIIKEYLHEG